MMTHFKTPKGTELPLMNLKGKPYLQVAHRVVWFREDHPMGRIDTYCVESSDRHVVYKAEISVPVGDGAYEKLADGVKREDFSHFADAHEKAQTGAIGRALALIGYGTQFAPEFDEEDRLADSPMDRAKRAPKPSSSAKAPPPAAAAAKPSVKAKAEAQPYVIPFGGAEVQGKTFEQVGVAKIKEMVTKLNLMIEQKGKPSQTVLDFMTAAQAWRSKQEAFQAQTLGVHAPDAAQDAFSGFAEQPTHLPLNDKPIVAGPGDYVVKGGKFNGKKVSEIGDENLRKFVAWANNRKDLTPEQIELVQYAETYLARVEKGAASTQATTH